MSKPVCVVCGVGPKNGAAFARRFSQDGYAIALLSRSVESGNAVGSELPDAKAYACDVSDEVAVATTFESIRRDLGEVDVLIFNAGSGSWGTIEEISAQDFERSWRVNAFGAFLAAQQVAPQMKARGRGTIVFVGATASLRGKPFTTAFAPAKAAQRSLAQALARHFGPSGVHVALMILDGTVGKPSGDEVTSLDPEHIAGAAAYLAGQDKSAWTFELDLRPHSETW